MIDDELVNKITSYPSLLAAGLVLGAVYIIIDRLNLSTFKFSGKWDLTALCELAGGVLGTIVFGRVVARLTKVELVISAAILLGGLVIGPGIAKVIVSRFL